MKTIFKFFKNVLAVLGTIAPIAGFLILLFREATTYIILVAFCAFLIILLCYIIYTLNKLINVKNPDGYINISAILKYSTIDGKNIDFNVFKVIQSKKLFLSEYLSEYKWDGKNQASISSTLQAIVNVKDDNDPSTYDSVVFKLKKPLFYNETDVIHFCGKSIDEDNISKPEVEVKVEHPFKLIHFIVELKHKKENGVANIKKKRIDSDLGNYQSLESVNFDLETKKFEHILLEPEVGYYYKIEWSK